MHTRVPLVRSGLAFLLVGLLLVGCGGKGTPPDVPAGTFTAHITGSLADTLSGRVHHRVAADGALTGLELGPKEGPGLSIELEPQPPALRTYEVVEAELFGIERDQQPAGVMAFLTLDRGTFEAVEGTLELTYVDDEQVGAAFAFQMEGEYDGGVNEAPSVEVTGVLNAPAER